MKEKIETFKVIWKNPRYHAIIELSLFFIFFFGIFLFIKFSPKNERIIYTSSLEQFRNKNNYQFQIEINDEIIDGSFIDSSIRLNYQNIEYIYEDEIIEPNDFPYIDALKYIDTKNIYNLIVDQEVYSKTEYNDGTISKVYKLNDLSIETYETNNEINKIRIEELDNIFDIIYE